MNAFDVVVCVVLISAAVSGFKAGLLRSAATILAYLIALPTAVFLMSLVSTGTGGKLDSPLLQGSPLLFGTFLITGIMFAKFMRMALEDVIGPDAGIADRFAGAALAIVRAGLVAITFVLSFDQLSSSGRQPAFLAGSQLRPLLSEAGQRGFKSLPPDVVAYIDRLKKDRRI
jgi:membrane protein required for colicin V production